MRWTTVIVTAACGGGAVPANAPIANAVVKSPPVVTRYCPKVRIAEWRSEVFPACGLPELDVGLPVCVGECPRPCSQSSSSESAMGQIHRDEPATPDERDARGRWIGTAGLRCTYRGDKLDSCESKHLSRHAERDASGRLVAVVMGDARTPITYDAYGRVATIGDDTFRYDTRGYLVDDDGLALEVDAHGRVLTATSPAEPAPPPDPNGELEIGPTPAKVTTYSYDGEHLVEVETPADSDHVDIAYDEQGRVTRVRWAHLEDTRTRLFNYDCK